MTDNHTVEQIDRDLAYKLLGSEIMRSGRWDNHPGLQAIAAHRLQAPGKAGALLPVELREQIEKLATKQEGYGMSFHAKGLGGRGPATLNVYGDRALAAMWIINHGLAALRANPPLDGNDIWEVLFAITEGDTPEGMTEDICQKLAEALNK